MSNIRVEETGAAASIGIGSTVTSGTDRSVLFIDGTAIGQDNTAFNFNKTTDTLTISTVKLSDGAVSTPSLFWGTDIGFYRVSNTIRFSRGGQEYIRIGSDGRISVGANATGEITSNGLFHAVYDGDPQDQDGILVVDTASDEGWTTSIGGRRSRGTSAVRTAVQTGDKLTEFMAKGHDGTSFSSNNRGYLGFYAAENFTSGAQGTDAIIGTCTIGATGNHNSVYITHKGDVAISKSASGITGAYSTGFTTGDNAKVLEVRADSTTDDAGVFIHNSNATKGVAVWMDTSANTAYVDSMYDNAAGVLAFRMKSLNGTPVTALSIADTGNFTMVGKVSTYRNIATANNGTLVTVGTPVHLTAQTASIGATSLYTADETGFYQICWSTSITTVATSSATLGHFQIQYTSPVDSVLKTSPTQNGVTGSTANTTGTCLGGTFTVYAKTGTAINYVMGYASSGATAMQYELDITVSKL